MARELQNDPDLGATVVGSDAPKVEAVVASLRQHGVTAARIERRIARASRGGSDDLELIIKP